MLRIGGGGRLSRGCMSPWRAQVHFSREVRSSFSFAKGDDVDFGTYHQVQDIKSHKIWFPKNKPYPQ
jgi:Rad3-related DNA helicase